MTRTSIHGRALRAVVLSLACLVPASRLRGQAPAAALLVPLAPNVYLTRSPLGNAVVALAPERGWVIVGPQSTAQQPALLHELASRSRLPVRFVVIAASSGLERNRDAGWSAAGAVVIAEEHAALRMSEGLAADYPGGDHPATAPATPALGFSEVQQIHLGSEDVHVVRQKPGSSNADLSAHFESAGVIYLGDAFIADGYPAVDEAHGGSIDGLIETSAKFMTWGPKTKLVPGRGEVSTPADLRAYHDMLVGIRGRVSAMRRAGRSLPAIVAAHPTAPYDSRWGRSGPAAADALVTAAYHSLAATRKP